MGSTVVHFTFVNDSKLVKSDIQREHYKLVVEVRVKELILDYSFKRIFTFIHIPQCKKKKRRLKVKGIQ